MTEQRPWGNYTILDEGIGYKVKRIIVNPGMRLSLQSHNKRSEHWVIVQGRGKVQVNEIVKEVVYNDVIYIPKEALHRIENTGQDTLIFIETQVGDYLGEDDIIRYSDDFGRV